MRFFPDRVWSLTIVTASIMIGTANLSVVSAGGDPNVKDKKVVQNARFFSINNGSINQD